VAALIQALIEQVERDAKAIQSKDIKIDALTHELAYYKRIRFRTKSEALAPLQRDVFEETWNTDISAIEAEVEQWADTEPCTTVAKPKRPRAARHPLPSHLPRIEHRHEPEICTCGHCGLAAVGLLSWVMISKFLDHLPLYRLEQIAARDGVVLSRSTLADWVGRLGMALQPLSDRLAWHPLQRDCLHADETPVPQLDPGNGKTKKAYLWAYRRNDLQPGPKILVFDDQAGRSGRHAGQFLGD
jgi:transposase